MDWQSACLASKYTVASRIDKQGRVYRRSWDGSAIVHFQGHVRDAESREVEGYEDWEPLQ